MSNYAALDSTYVSLFGDFETPGFVKEWTDDDTRSSFGNQNFTLRRSCVLDYLSIICNGRFTEHATQEDVARHIIEMDGAKIFQWCCIADGPRCNSTDLLYCIGRMDTSSPYFMLNHTTKDALTDVELNEYDSWYTDTTEDLGTRIGSSRTREQTIQCLVEAADQNDRMSFTAIASLLTDYWYENDVEGSPLNREEGWNVIAAIGERTDHIEFNWVKRMKLLVDFVCFCDHDYDVTKRIVQGLWICDPDAAANVALSSPCHTVSLMAEVWHDEVETYDGDVASADTAVVELTRRFFRGACSFTHVDWRVYGETLNAICRTVGMSRGAFLKFVGAKDADSHYIRMMPRGRIALAAGVLREAEQRKTLSRAFDAWLELSDVYNPNKFLRRRGRDEFEADMERQAASAASKAHRSA